MDQAYRRRNARDRWHNWSALRHGQLDGFLVTSKNSGTHWIKYMLCVAMADTYGIEPPQYFSQAATTPYIGGPKDKPAFDVLPRLAFSHSIPHEFMNWGWARSALGVPPYVLLIRHPMQILASHHTKWNYELEVDWKDYLRGDASGSKYRCDLFWLARFWNRWGELEARDPENLYRVHYEAARKEPEAILRGIAKHLGLDLKETSFAVALEAGTKEAMEKKVDPNGEINVLQRRSQTLSELFSGEAYDIYRDRVTEYFQFDLGYDLLSSPE